MNTKKTEDTFLVGPKPVLEFLQKNSSKVLSVFVQEHRHGKEISSIYTICKQNRIPYKVCDIQTLNRLYSGKHQGILAKIAAVELFSLEDLVNTGLNSILPLIVALDMVQDVGNFGTLVRTLYAMGAGGVVLPKHGSVTPNSAAMRSSAGTLQNFPISIVTNMSNSLEYVKKAGYTIYGTVCSNTAEAVNALTTKLSLPAVLVLGNEENGIRPLVLRQCDIALHIPMEHGYNSINIAQSAAIFTTLFVLSNKK
ncbi:MAG: 23S rRNA (guanosine(2251)-2'-O)-methyltransferase RlmB [Desulfovibrionaceae bacterium]